MFPPASRGSRSSRSSARSPGSSRLKDAISTARSVRSGGTRAVDVAAEALERAEAASPLNAFTRLDPDGALTAARRVDEVVAAGEDPGPLAGVPVALKDIVDQAGTPTTAGSSFLEHPASTDAEVVVRLRRAGAVVIGRTGLHEFAYGFSSENDWWGPVLNPWDPTTSPGGSSGGSAAAVAAGVAPIGIGTDTGGSVRVPAALCGVVGLKVTHGRIPLTGVFPLASSLDTVGPITRTVADAAVAYSAMTTENALFSPARIEELSIAIPHPWVDRTIAPEQTAGLRHAREALSAAGARVEDIEIPEIDERDIERHPGLYHEAADVHREWFLADRTRYGDAIRDRLAATLENSEAQISAALEWRRGFVRTMADVFTEWDLILTPATAARAKVIGSDHIDVGAGPEPYRPVLSWFTPLVNQAGVPAIALPIEAPDVVGLPPSVQFIAPMWEESRLLELGAALDEAGVVARRTPPDFAS